MRITVDGKWSPWSLWSTCSRSCGVGARTRRRECTLPPAMFGGAECDGLSEKRQLCKMTDCEGEAFSHLLLPSLVITSAFLACDPTAQNIFWKPEGCLDYKTYKAKEWG